VERGLKFGLGTTEEDIMAAKTQKIRMKGKLSKVTKVGDRYAFIMRVDSAPAGLGGDYHFSLTRDKALAIATANHEFPMGTTLKVSGRVSKRSPKQLNHVKIISVDGVELQSWSERVGSPQVAPDVLEKAKARVAAAKKAEADMLDRAPPQSDQAFANPKQAFDEAMRIVRRQAKLKNPKLSGSEIFKLRDALNFFAEKLGL
jgi:hypothetical protein